MTHFILPTASIVSLHTCYTICVPFCKASSTHNPSSGLTVSVSESLLELLPTWNVKTPGGIRQSCLSTSHIERSFFR